MILRYFFSGGKPTIYFWILLYIIALAARLAIFFILTNTYGPGVVYLAGHNEPIVGHDTQHYMVIAHNLVENNGYSRFITPPFDHDGVRTPLYPMALVPFIYVFGYPYGITYAVFAMNFLWALTPIVACIVARKFLRLRYAILVGVAIAIDPLLVFRSNIAEPDALLALLFIATSYFFIRYWQMPNRPKYAYATAVGFGLMILAKPIAIYASGVMLAALLVKMILHNSSWRFRIISGAASISIVAAMLAPWLAYYYLSFGVIDISSASLSALYTYSTKTLKVPGEPTNPPFDTREPQRDPRNKYFYRDIVAQRITHDPVRYLREQISGAYENIKSAELNEIRWYKLDDIIPFNYFSLQHKLQITDSMMDDKVAAVSSMLRVRTLLSSLRNTLLLFFFIVILINLLMLSRINKNIFYLSILFFCISLFFITHSGSVIAPKYRLPALPFMLILFFQGIQNIFNYKASAKPIYDI